MTRTHKWIATTAGVAAICGGLAIATAQPATPEQRTGVEQRNGYGTLHLQTNLGSVKLLGGADPAAGRYDMTFTGTVLVNCEDCQVVTEGQVRVEQEYPEYDRTLYSGSGRMIVTGEWDGLQWFGTDMRAVWYGVGIARVSGDFDRNLETGWFWYDDPNDRQAWPEQGTREVPNPIPGTGGVVPQREDPGA